MSEVLVSIDHSPSRKLGKGSVVQQHPSIGLGGANEWRRLPNRAKVYVA